MTKLGYVSRETSSSYTSQKRGPNETHLFHFSECKTLDEGWATSP